MNEQQDKQRVIPQDRPIAVTDLMRQRHLLPTVEWGCTGSPGWSGLLAGKRKLFSAVDATLGEASLAWKAVNGLRETLDYIERLEDALLNPITKEQVASATYNLATRLLTTCKKGNTIDVDKTDELVREFVAGLFPEEAPAEANHG